MIAHLRRSVVACLLLASLAFAYALAATGLSQVLFSHQANGSITAEGSTLIGQNWSSNRWFHGRPDDTGPYAADPQTSPPRSGGDNPLTANGVAGESGATNLGPRSRTLLDDTKALVAYWHARGVQPTPDLVTTSGSGYDPDIAPDDALVQIPMVVRATGISAVRLRALIAAQTRGAELGFLGSSWIDVLTLNEGLTRLER